MKQLIVKVPDNKYPFFQELIQSLGYEAFSNDSHVTPAMEAAVNAEFKRIVEELAYPLNWSEARKTLRRSNGHASAENYACCPRRCKGRDGFL